jgi:hypothetical protein
MCHILGRHGACCLGTKLVHKACKAKQKRLAVRYIKSGINWLINCLGGMCRNSATPAALSCGGGGGGGNTSYLALILVCNRCDCRDNGTALPANVSAAMNACAADTVSTVARVLCLTHKSGDLLSGLLCSTPAFQQSNCTCHICCGHQGSVANLPRSHQL